MSYVAGKRTLPPSSAARVDVIADSAKVLICEPAYWKMKNVATPMKASSSVKAIPRNMVT